MARAEMRSVDRSAAQVAARAAAWLARNPEGPFFLWVHLNDPEAASGASYNAAVAAVDAAAGKLIALLRTRKLYDDALVVVASDHGRGLGEHGEETHGIFLYDETIHVPLLLKLPQNQSAGKRVSARASLVDVAPTVLAIAGVPIPSQMQGQSLLRISKTNADQPVYSVSDFPQRAFGWSPLESWRAGKYLYIKAPRPELYDLSADPGPRATWRRLPRPRWKPSPASWMPSTGASAAPVLPEALNLLPAKCRSWPRWDMSACRNPLVQSAAATGVDPKDGIAAANKVLSALALLNQGKPEKAAAILQPVLATGSKMYLAQFVMGAALARQQQYPGPSSICAMP